MKTIIISKDILMAGILENIVAIGIMETDYIKMDEENISLLKGKRKALVKMLHEIEISNKENFEVNI